MTGMHVLIAPRAESVVMGRLSVSGITGHVIVISCRECFDVLFFCNVYSRVVATIIM